MTSSKKVIFPVPWRDGPYPFPSLGGRGQTSFRSPGKRGLTGMGGFWTAMRFFPEATEALIFDVDGTLYDQGKLRRRMLLNLLFSLARNPLFIRDINVLHTFRKKRELLPENGEEGDCIDRRQYEEVAQALGLGVVEVRRIVDDWIFEKPLKHLAQCLYPGVRDLFSILKQKKYKIGIFSDYPCHAKLQALDLKVDAMVCSTDEQVDRLKPHPAGLLFTARELGVPVTNCFFIGDRDDKDGECARRAGMPYLILSRHRVSAADWYREALAQISRMD
jgi:putative hydrolase of the HAD superfamily